MLNDSGELAALSSIQRTFHRLPVQAPEIRTFFDCGMQHLKTQSVVNKTFKIRGQILSDDWIKNQGHFNVVLVFF